MDGLSGDCQNRLRKRAARVLSENRLRERAARVCQNRLRERAAQGEGIHVERHRDPISTPDYVPLLWHLASRR